MEQAELQPLYDSYHRKIAKVDLRFKRYLYSQINWKARIISIKGARGVGKTTMLLQHILRTMRTSTRLSMPRWTICGLPHTV